MSYLNVPRLHFAGNFQADPSTINNNDSNFDPTVTLKEEPPDPQDPANTSVYWNPYGTHNWKLQDCTVRSAVNDAGTLITGTGDPLIGATVKSVSPYPAKIVDLDPDNQSVSQIWGLQIEIAIPNPSDPSTPLGSVTVAMPPTAFCDLWNRGTNHQPGMPTMSASWQAVLTVLNWTNPSASPILQALNALSPTALSIRFNVDSFQSDSNQENFTFGRVVGTIGPSSATEAPRSTPRRLAPYFPQGQPPSIMSAYGPAGFVWDPTSGVLTVDLGNCVPTNATTPGTGPSVPDAGWPLVTTTLQFCMGIPTTLPAGSIKTGATAPSLPLIANVTMDTPTYLTQAGVVQIQVPGSVAPFLFNNPITVFNATTGAVAVQEDAQGRYVDIDVPFFRLNPGDTAPFTLWATLFGAPWSGASLDIALQPVCPALNGPQPPVQAVWNNNDPQSALTMTPPGGQPSSSITAVTGTNGTATVTLTASDPGTPRTYPDGEPGPDGQVYYASGSWAAWGQIFLFSGAPINALVFSGYPVPAKPTWDQHVGPILSNYARMFPYMKGIIDLGDYPTVVSNIDGIQYVLNLPPTDPHHMPVVRDLSAGKLATINLWITNGTPKSP